VKLARNSAAAENCSVYSAGRRVRSGRHRDGSLVYNNYAIANLLYKIYSRIHLHQMDAIAAYRRQLR